MAPLLLAACVLVAVAMPLTAAHREGYHCGSPEPTSEVMSVVQARLDAARMAKTGAADPSLAARKMAAVIAVQQLAERVFRAKQANPGDRAIITVPTYFHILRSGTTVAEGNVPDNIIQDQMQELNTVLGKFGAVEFALAGVTRTTNVSWAEDIVQPSQTVTDFKSALRKGGAGVLNVYTTSFSDRKLLGIGLPPYYYDNDPIEDGVTLNFKTMPNVPDGPVGLNAGGTLAHEVGHWLGLFHPFQGGCTDPDGDFIDDTPAQKEPQYGCSPESSVTVDSCPLKAGDDLKFNIMDYYDDACLVDLTQGQVNRIVEAFLEFRADARTRTQIQNAVGTSTQKILQQLKEIDDAEAAAIATRR